MIKGEISGAAEVNKERQPDYKQGKDVTERLFCKHLGDLQYFPEAEREFTYFSECKQGAGLILGVFSAREAPK